MSKNKEKINFDELKGRINTNVEFMDKKSISIITSKTIPNLDCVDCAASPDCRGKSPKDSLCNKIEPRN